MVEVLISLLMICLATVAIGSALSATVKTDRARDINVAVKSQNISTVEYLRDAVRSSDDVWKMFQTYNTEILGYKAETTANVLAVERGRVDPLDRSLISTLSSAVYNHNISVGDRTFGTGVALNTSGSSVTIKGSSMSSYSQAIIGIACVPGTIGMYKIDYDGVSKTKTIRADEYTDNTSSELIQISGTSDIKITNLNSTPVCVVNTYFVQDSTVMGYEEEDNIVNNLKDNTQTNEPTLFRVDIETKITGNGSSQDSDEVLEKYNRNNKVSTFIILKE